MNSKSMRRLAADHGSLHTAGLPPNYLFPPSTDNADLTALDVLLAGPVGTPYANGVWRLHLDIPPGYPAAPPTAQFRTRLWHPNIDESTGAVCVETLKRDWTSTLKLRDVLVTISCLLIQPNPASALNETAGKMASEDWDGFCRRAKLMTEIHAAVPTSLVAEVKEAQMRGEDVTAEAGPVQPEKKSAAQGKGKEGVKATPGAPKVQQVVDEDEENTRRRAETQEPASDPESDWIPGPKQTPKAAARRNNNIFGIKGLEDDMQLDTPPKRVFTPKSSQNEQDDKENDISGPFITVPSKRPAPASQEFNLNVPSGPSTKQSHQATDTPELLKYSHANPFSAIQPNNQVNPLLKEFSYSWEETQTLHDTDPAANGDAKKEVRKRLAGEDFEKKRTWEMKRFKKAGYDLTRYNRGDFGPKTGIGRL